VVGYVVIDIDAAHSTPFCRWLMLAPSAAGAFKPGHRSNLELPCTATSTKEFSWLKPLPSVAKRRRGQSVTARLLAQYLIDKGMPFTGFDTDRSHHSFNRFYDFTQYALKA
jgi:hypothetical protein